MSPLSTPSRFPRGHACCPWGRVCKSRELAAHRPCVQNHAGRLTTEAAVIAITPPAAFSRVRIHKDAEASGACETDWEVLQPSSGTRGMGAWVSRSTHSIQPQAAPLPSQSRCLWCEAVCCPSRASFEGGTPGATDACGHTPVPRHILAYTCPATRRCLLEAHMRRHRAGSWGETLGG